VIDTKLYKIETGNLIWIPKNKQRMINYYLTRTARFAGVIGAVATLVLLFKR